MMKIIHKAGGGLVVRRITESLPVRLRKKKTSLYPISVKANPSVEMPDIERYPPADDAVHISIDFCDGED